MATKANLLDGPGLLYIAPTGEALPELDDLTPPAITVTPAGNWTAEGFFLEGHELDIEVEWEQRFVDQHLGPIRQVAVREGGLFKVKFVEEDLTAYNVGLSSRTTLSTVAAGADQTAQDQLGFGDKASTTERSLLFVSTNPEAGSRLIHIPIAVATENLALVSKLAGEGFDIGFSILADPTKSAGERMLKFYDITAVASS